MSINVAVPQVMRTWVHSRIESGESASVSDYVRDLIRRDQEARQRKLGVADLRRTIEESRAEGRVPPAEDVFGRLDAKLRDLAR